MPLTDGTRTQMGRGSCFLLSTMCHGPCSALPTPAGNCASQTCSFKGLAITLTDFNTQEYAEPSTVTRDTGPESPPSLRFLPPFSLHRADGQTQAFGFGPWIKQSVPQLFLILEREEPATFITSILLQPSFSSSSRHHHQTRLFLSLQNQGSSFHS